MKLNLQLSCYNGARYLPYLFDSLKKQTLREWHLFVLDNASNEENKKQIEQAVAESSLPVTLFRVEQNIGFAGAHNFLFEKTKHRSEMIQLLNDDAILDPLFLERCAEYLSAHPAIASVSGRVYRWNFDHQGDSQGGRSNIIDSFGIETNALGLIRDIGSGQTEKESGLAPTGTVPVFGISGCLPMYRVSAVVRSTIDGNLFDESYVSYKEDVDLAFRFRAAGYGAAIVDGALAWHRRSYGMKTTDLRRPVNDTAYQSYRNHLWLWIAHLPLLSFVTNRIGLLPIEGMKAIYWLIRKPSFIFRMIKETARKWPELMFKRKRIAEIRTAEPLDVNRPKKPSVDLAIILVSHNDLNEANLRSLQAARVCFSGTSAVVVVDNRSETYVANELVETLIPDAWTLLRHGDHGYGRSMNMGAAMVDAESYFILNPDTILPDPELFNRFREYTHANPEVGLVGPRILNFTGELQDTARRFPRWFQPLIQRTSLKHTEFGKQYLETFLMHDTDRTQTRSVDWVQGSAMWLPGKVWKQLGGFDDRFWLYFEDIDLCRRVWELGLTVKYLPSVVIQHAHGRQSARIQNLLLNILKTKETRGHLISWVKYEWKWRFEPSKTPN